MSHEGRVAGEIMQNHEPERSNLESSNIKITEANFTSGNYHKFFIALWLMAASLLSAARAQETNDTKPEQSPTPAVTKKVINLWPNVAPGSEQWKQPETTLGSEYREQVVNVTTPTLTAYLPQSSLATGMAVIIAPGGGFIGLSINPEGHDVAKWLVARGFAAIVLKYRTKQIEGKDATQLGQSARAAFMAQLNNHALIAEDGNILAESERFGHEPQLICSELDLDRLVQERMRQTSFGQSVARERDRLQRFRRVRFPLELPRQVSTKPRMVSNSAAASSVSVVTMFAAMNGNSALPYTSAGSQGCAGTKRRPSRHSINTVATKASA